MLPIPITSLIRTVRIIGLPTSIDYSFKEFSYNPLPKVRPLNSNISIEECLLKVSMIAWTIKCRKSVSNRVYFHLGSLFIYIIFFIETLSRLAPFGSLWLSCQQNTDLPRRVRTIITLHGDRIQIQTYYKILTILIYIFLCFLL